MNLHQIHHIAILCSDREKAVDFYVRKLGFPIIREHYRADRGDTKIDLQLSPETELELFITSGRPDRVTNPEAYGLRHLAFRVDSVPETVAALQEKGIPCEPIRMDPYTRKAMTCFRDPDDLPLEIHE